MAISPEAVMRSPDRVLIMNVKDPKVKDTGLMDPRLATGENRLHVIKEEQTGFWYFKYEHGGLPEPLKCKFTGFKQALKHAEDYYNKRNIAITEVID